MNKRSKAKREAIIGEALKRFDIAQEAWQEVYEDALSDVEFVDVEDSQWPDDVKDKRKSRPTMTFDRTSQAVDQVVGDHLQNKPGIKVRGAEDDDADGAEIYEGLIRQIESRGKQAYNTGFKFSAKGGFGVWGLDHDYIRDDSFDQDIILREFKNPFAVLLDPAIQTGPLEDMRYGFVFDDMAKAEFEKQWPKASSSASEQFRLTGSMQSWITEDKVRVASYYRLAPVEKVICQLSTGEVVDKEEFEPIADELALQGVTVKRERTVQGFKLEHFKLTAMEILEEIECIGSYVPLIPIFGKNVVVDGKFITRGIVRKAKDPQRLHNYEFNNYVETIALQPKQPYLATAAMLKGHEEKWAAINTSNDPVLLYNPDPTAPTGKPDRQPPAMPSGGLLNAIQLSSDAIKSATGIYDAGLGQRSNETSGKAIMARQREGDTGTYEFTDELVMAIGHTGRIMVEWIPLVYDAQRQVRILGEDDAEEVMEINKPTQDLETLEWHTVNDLSRGKYDIKVTVGPSYSTRRTETAEHLNQLMTQNPEIGQLIADLYVNTLDIVGADEAKERIRKHLIQKGIADPTDDEIQGMVEQAQKKQQIQQVMKQVQPPNPLQEAMKQLKMVDMQEEVRGKKVENDKKQAETQKVVAEIGKVQSEQHLNQTKAATMRYDATTKSLVAA